MSRDSMARAYASMTAPISAIAFAGFGALVEVGVVVGGTGAGDALGKLVTGAPELGRTWLAGGTTGLTMGGGGDGGCAPPGEVAGAPADELADELTGGLAGGDDEAVFCCCG